MTAFCCGACATKREGATASTLRLVALSALLFKFPNQSEPSAL